jgi:predicted ATP-grasp superfamily ATP-dependent carboligase
VVQAADKPELFEPTRRLLERMRFTGIAEVEYKWDQSAGKYKLIEINPRPWDQHRLGPSCGVDLMYLAYCEHAGLPVEPVKAVPSRRKWIAEDVFFTTAMRSLVRRDGQFKPLMRLVRGKRIWAIWTAKDPLPFCAYILLQFLPDLARRLCATAGARTPRRQGVPAKGGSIS